MPASRPRQGPAPRAAPAPPAAPAAPSHVRLEAALPRRPPRLRPKLRLRRQLRCPGQRPSVAQVTDHQDDSRGNRDHTIDVPSKCPGGRALHPPPLRCPREHGARLACGEQRGPRSPTHVGDSGGRLGVLSSRCSRQGLGGVSRAGLCPTRGSEPPALVTSGSCLQKPLCAPIRMWPPRAASAHLPGAPEVAVLDRPAAGRWTLPARPGPGDQTAGTVTPPSAGPSPASLTVPTTEPPVPCAGPVQRPARSAEQAPFRASQHKDEGQTGRLTEAALLQFTFRSNTVTMTSALWRKGERLLRRG